MDNYLFFVHGLVAGFSIGLIIMFTILRRNHYEPGKATDFYPFKFSMNVYLAGSIVVLSTANIISFLGAPLANHLTGGFVLGIYGLYCAGMFILNRHGLLHVPMSVAVLLLPTTSLPTCSYSFVFLIILTLIVFYFNKRANESYNKRYYTWCKKRAHNLHKAYKKTFDLYDVELQSFLLTFMLVEDTARPKSVRYAERLKLLFFKDEVTTGIMQVKSTSSLSDAESAKKGFEILHKIYGSISPDLSLTKKLELLAYEYNGDKEYAKFLGYFYKTSLSVTTPPATQSVSDTLF